MFFSPCVKFLLLIVKSITCFEKIIKSQTLGNAPIICSITNSSKRPFKAVLSESVLCLLDLFRRQPREKIHKSLGRLKPKHLSLHTTNGFLHRGYAFGHIIDVESPTCSKSCLGGICLSLKLAQGFFKTHPLVDHGRQLDIKGIPCTHQLNNKISPFFSS